MYFLTYGLRKTSLDKSLKSAVSEDPSTSNMRNGPTHYFTAQHLYHIYWSLWRLFIWKKSLLVIWKFLGRFLNTLDANDKYSVLIRHNLSQHLQMQLSQKEKAFSVLFFFFFFFSFWKSKFNFKYFQKKDHRHSWCIF